MALAVFAVCELVGLATGDELEGICAFYALLPWTFRTFSKTLAETAEFVGIGGVPDSGELEVFAQLSVL